MTFHISQIIIFCFVFFVFVMLFRPLRCTCQAQLSVKTSKNSFYCTREYRQLKSWMIDFFLSSEIILCPRVMYRLLLSHSSFVNWQNSFVYIIKIPLFSLSFIVSPFFFLGNWKLK